MTERGGRNRADGGAGRGGQGGGFRGGGRGSRGGGPARGGRGERGFSRDDRGYSRDDRGYSRDDRGFSRDDRRDARGERGYSRDDRGYSRDDRRSARGGSWGERSYDREDRGYGRREGRFEGGGFDRSTGRRRGDERREPREAREPRERFGADAVRKAAQNRPEGGYTVADFDDIPMQPKQGPDHTRTEDVDGSMRLQKALANAGVASRRVCEIMIAEGRVTVNGTTVTELGSRVHPERDRIEVDGTPVQTDSSKRYVILNKPTGVVSTMRDEQGRPDLRQFARQYGERVYNVGRLDAETSGLLILTNDGDLANVLAHPSYGVEKTYVALVRGRVTPQTLQRLLDGFELEDGFIRADRAHIHADQPSRQATLVELTLHSGRNRIVRRMFDHVGHPVQELVRRSFGPLHLGTLRVGESRELTTLELGKLLTLARRAERRPERVDGERPAPRDRQAPSRREPRAAGNRAERRAETRRDERDSGERPAGRRGSSGRDERGRGAGGRGDGGRETGGRGGRRRDGR